MKYILAFIAATTQAVKLLTEVAEDSWETRAERLHTVIDWNGDGLVDGDELKDLIWVSKTYGYITQSEADNLDNFVDSVIAHFGGPFSYADLAEFQ